MATWTGGLLGGELRGVSGNAVFVRTPHGVVVRDRVVPRDPQSPAQREVRAIQRRAAQAWTDLEPGAVALWTAYARAVKRQPNNAFATLYKVLLRLDPAAPVPLAPPARPFFGDTMFVDCGMGIVEGPANDDPRSAIVTFSSSGANAPGVVTELLVQPLASRHRRTYLEKYRHAAYVAFEGPQTVAVPAPEGWVALAYRFVNAETGQVTAIAELGAVRAG